MRYNELTTEARTLGGFAVKPVNVQGQEVDEATGPVTHRIGLTVTDPNHPMVSKRRETYQKTVRVTGPDREKAINGAIAHARRKGYKVHDHHYMGTVDDEIKEFAPPGSGDDGNDGFSDETLKRMAAQWWQGDEDPRIEKTLMAAGWEIGQDEGYDDEPGVFVVQAGDVNGNSYMSWPAEELKGLSEGATGAKPGWMLKQDPALAKKVKDSKRGHEELKKWAGKTAPKDKAVDEAIKLNAPQRRIDRDELQGYADRIKTGTKTKQDKFSPIIHGSNIKAITTDSGEEWDLDDLARQITTRPRAILGTNAKMEKSANEGEIVYDLTLPALSGIVVDEENGDFVEITTCPGAGECQLFCYARKGGYVMFPASSMSAAQALNFLVNDPEGYNAVVNKEIKTIKAKTDKRSIQLVVRWHDAGDFFSKEYLDLAYGVAEANPDVKFYAYTKMGDVATGNKPANFIINFSSGAKRAQDKKIEIHKAAGNPVKQGLTLPKDMFRGLFVTDAKGKYVKDEKGRTQVKGEAEWNQFKQNLAAKYKIDPGTIITYDQMLKVPEGPQPKWNVVIFPAGHGDRAANRLDVENSFLMFH